MALTPGPVTFASRDAEDEYWMGVALDEAKAAATAGEVPGKSVV